MAGRIESVKQIGGRSTVISPASRYRKAVCQLWLIIFSGTAVPGSAPTQQQQQSISQAPASFDPTGDSADDEPAANGDVEDNDDDQRQAPAEQKDPWCPHEQKWTKVDHLAESTEPVWTETTVPTPAAGCHPWAYFKMMLPASIVLVIVAATNANLSPTTKTTENEIYQLFGVLFAANFHSVRTHFDLWRTDDSWQSSGGVRKKKRRKLQQQLDLRRCAVLLTSRLPKESQSLSSVVESKFSTLLRLDFGAAAPVAVERRPECAVQPIRHLRPLFQCAMMLAVSCDTLPIIVQSSRPNGVNSEQFACRKQIREFCPRFSQSLNK